MNILTATADGKKQKNTCTPGWVSCINSKSLLTTVFKNFQCALKKRGYCPTTYLQPPTHFNT
jgi:hypothetical protein